MWHRSEQVDTLLLGSKIKTNSSLWNWNPRSWYPNYIMQWNIFLLSISFEERPAEFIKLLFSVERWGPASRQEKCVEARDIPNRAGYDLESSTWKPNEEFKVGGMGVGGLRSHLRAAEQTCMIKFMLTETFKKARYSNACLSSQYPKETEG